MKRALIISGQPVYFDVEPRDTQATIACKMVDAINYSVDTLAMAMVDEDNPELINVYTVGGTA